MDIIPLPAHIEVRPGTHQLAPETTILTDTANGWNADYLRQLLLPATGYPLPVQTDEGHGKNLIRLHLDPTLTTLGTEGYRLEVQPGQVRVEAPTTTGIFYGIQSLRQLLPPQIEQRRPVSADWSIPCLTITDQPRFPWRGFMLDEGRHFQGKATVLLTLDLMALQKLNILHWHLTEDQGWRIEIKKYPRLTEVGAWRTGTSAGFTNAAFDGIPHGGFYTQTEIREIVAYAAERHITVVPEIELPGHSTAALAAYPGLSCTGGPFEVATYFGVHPNIFCAGKEATFTFLQDVLDEVMDLFPSPFIHIGGDEAPKRNWKACPDCQKRLRSTGVKDEHALQTWFTNRIVAYLESKGRRSIGWNEILQDGLTESAVVQYWVGGRRKLINAIRNGGRAAIMSTWRDTYLDHDYKLMPLSRAYNYEPIPRELKNLHPHSVLGPEFPLWTEWVPNRSRFDYQAYPRLTAMAETGWTPKERKDLAGFRLRLDKFLLRLDIFGVKYASLAQAEPAKIKRLFGIFSFVKPQTATRDG